MPWIGFDQMRGWSEERTEAFLRGTWLEKDIPPEERHRRLWKHLDAFTPPELLGRACSEPGCPYRPWWFRGAKPACVVHR